MHFCRICIILEFWLDCCALVSDFGLTNGDQSKFVSLSDIYSMMYNKNGEYNIKSWKIVLYILNIVKHCLYVWSWS